MSVTNNTTAAEILQNKLDARIEKGQHDSKTYLDKIEKEGSLLNDFILPLRSNKKVSFYMPEEDKKVHMSIANGTNLDYSVHSHAVGQAATKLGANSSYIKNLAESGLDWQVKLAAHNLNEHASYGPRDRALVREVGGEVRGFLSDEYRRLNSPLLYQSFISASVKAGGLIYSAFADDTRSWIEVLLPHVIDIPTVKNGTVTIAYGMRMATSDFGDGALELRSFMIQVVCLNGLVMDSILRQVHLGRKMPDDIKLSDQTYLYDTKTQASLIGDSVKQLMNTDSIMKQASTVQKASDIEVDFDTEFKQLSRVDMRKGEVEQVKDIITSN